MINDERMMKNGILQKKRMAQRVAKMLTTNQDVLYCRPRIADGQKRYGHEMNWNSEDLRLKKTYLTLPLTTN